VNLNALTRRQASNSKVLQVTGPLRYTCYVRFYLGASIFRGAGFFSWFLFRLVGGTVASLWLVVLFALVGGTLSLIGGNFALVGGTLAMVGGTLDLVGGAPRLNY
jgi:hypothetical protein